MEILVSAGEASGDLYAAELVSALRRRHAGLRFFGCAGERLKAAGVEPVVDAASLAVVGIVEVLGHIPRIYGEFKKLREAAARRRPKAAILTDSPDFHLRLAPHLRRLGIPVIYLVAPQVWAWRAHRLRTIRRNIKRLLCIFPFEEEFFRRHGVEADYIGHPLSRLVKPALGREEFFAKHRMAKERPVVTLLPGSRKGEIDRHLPYLVGAVNRLYEVKAATFLLALPAGLAEADRREVEQRVAGYPVLVVAGESWDAMAHADVVLPASGTVTVEAALLGKPMVTYYRVSEWTYRIGKPLVKVEHYTMVNLIAGKKVVPELIQHECTAERLAAETLRLLEDEPARKQMRAELEQVARKLASEEAPLERAAGIVETYLVGE